MSNGTGENDMMLHKISEFMRAASIIILLGHFYFSCYFLFLKHEWTAVVVDRFILIIAKTGLLNGNNAKLTALGLLLLSLIGSKGRKDEKIRRKETFFLIGVGLLFFLCSEIILDWGLSVEVRCGLYMGVSGVGYLLTLLGLSRFSRFFKMDLGK